MCDFYTTIGLEIHAQLNTKSKMFSSEKTSFGALPNTTVSEVSLALPGTLPYPNLSAIQKCIMLGLSCKSKIAKEVLFHRKNYTYPDLPKGYQISQDAEPLCSGGAIKINKSDGGTKDILLKRIHLEEDTGKSVHYKDKKESHLDFNRAGSPLLEIVTEPCINSAEEAYNFVIEVRKLVRYLEICDGNMEEGSLRCDVNVSISRKIDEYGERVEVKNLNSIKSVMMSVNYEVDRHKKIILSGEKVENETRTYIAEQNKTVSMRKKESMEDYRYFVEPNIPPLDLDSEFIAAIKRNIPLLPREYYDKFVNDYKLSNYDAEILSSSKDFAIYFDSACQNANNKKTVANIVMGPMKAYINELNIELSDLKIDSSQISLLSQMVDDGKINFSSAQLIFSKMAEDASLNPNVVANKLNLIQSEEIGDLESIIARVLSDFPEKVTSYKNGQIGLLNFFLGQVIKSLDKKVNPEIIRDSILEILKK